MKNNILKSLLLLLIITCFVENKGYAVELNHCSITCPDGSSCSVSSTGEVGCHCMPDTGADCHEAGMVVLPGSQGNTNIIKSNQNSIKNLPVTTGK